MNTYTRAPFLFLILLMAFGSADGSTEIADAIFP